MGVTRVRQTALHVDVHKLVELDTGHIRIAQSNAPVKGGSISAKPDVFSVYPMRPGFSCADEPSALLVEEIHLVVDRLRTQLCDLANPAYRFLRDDLDKDTPIQGRFMLTMERLGRDGELGSAFLADEPVRDLELRLPK